MKKELPVQPNLYPQLVLMIATYNEDGSPNLMNAAWGGTIDNDLIVLSLDSTHMTAKNIEKRKAFTLSIATSSKIKECDFVGIVSGNDDPNKFSKTGFSHLPSNKVDAPVIEDLPISYECEVVKISDDELGYLVFGRVKGILADEKVLNEKGRVDFDKLDALCLDPFSFQYRKVGEKAGQAFQIGRSLAK